MERLIIGISGAVVNSDANIYDAKHVACGRCIDNGPMEGCWGILKCEMYYLSNFKDYDSLVAAVKSYIYFYNYERRQRRLSNCLR